MSHIFEDCKLNIIVGAYGSGKSEISVNAALSIKEGLPEQKVLLADMDIVNPFYRSVDAKEVIESKGIKMIAPSYANSNVDAPVLGGEMFIIFDDDSYKGVFDIGGEDMGATILGSLNKRLEKIDYKLWMAVNTLRPFTSTAEEIAQMTYELSQAANLKIDGYINNTNLLEETTPEAVVEGEKIILEASKLTGVPLVMTTVMEDVNLTPEMVSTPELLRLKRTIRYNY